MRCYLADLSPAFIDITVNHHLTISFLKSRGEKWRKENYIQFSFMWFHVVFAKAVILKAREGFSLAK